MVCLAIALSVVAMIGAQSVRGAKMSHSATTVQTARLESSNTPPGLRSRAATTVVPAILLQAMRPGDRQALTPLVSTASRLLNPFCRDRSVAGRGPRASGRLEHINL